MGQIEQQAFKPRPRHLVPIALGLIVTGLLSYPFQGAQSPSVQVTPFVGDSLASASLNAVVLVLALGASATIMFLLIRRGRKRFIGQLVKGALFLVSFAAVLWYASSVFSLPGDPLTATALLLGLSAGIAVAIGVLVFGKGKLRQLSGVTAVSALTGVFLGSSIGPVTAIVLVAALVMYDVVAVFRGPVGALARALEPGDLPGAMFSYGELTIGLGDLVFYSLLATTAMVYFGFLPFLGASIGILAGTYLGFRALSRFEMFPGLPLSLLLGVAGMLLTFLLQRL